MILARVYGRRAAVWLLAFALVAPATAYGQVRQALFQGGNAGGYPSQNAGYLGGGSGDWVNAYGEPAIVPASFQNGCCPSGGGGCGMPGGCGMGGGCGPMSGCPCCTAGGGPYGPGGPWGDACGMDPACELYGNGGPDQCGPHFFDFSAEAMYWQRVDSADPSRVFATVGITDVSLGVDEGLALTTDDLDLGYEPGVRLTGRYDLGALSLLEVSYNGLYEWGAVSTLTGASNIYTGFSNFGVGFDTDGNGVPDQAVGGAGLDATEQAALARLELISELHNTEISIRRYWVGFNPRVTGTVMAGVRYTNLREQLDFSTSGLGGSSFFSSLAENHLVGAQTGGDVWVCVRQGWRVGATGKVGIYNNRTDYEVNITSTDADAPSLFEDVQSDHVSFIGEAGVSVVGDILPSWSVRAGYDVLFINTVALATNNFDFNNAPFLGDTRSPMLIEESSALYHGASLGLEYVW